MSATARWAEDQPGEPIEASDIPRLWTEIEAHVGRPVVLVVEADGAEIGAVVGERSGSVLTYIPRGYEQTGIGSLHSLGDPERADRGEEEPLVTAYYLGHHTEFPRWSVVSHSKAREALAAFCDRPQDPPTAMEWEPD